MGRYLILLNLLFWLIITVIAATLYFISFGDDYDGNWWTFFWRQLPIWMFWGFASIPLFFLVKHLKRKSFSFIQQIVFHFFSFGIVFFVFYLFFVSYSLYLSGEQITIDAIFSASSIQLVLYYILNLLVYLLIISLLYGWFWYSELQASRLENSVMVTQLHEAKLKMLTAQIHPHFLFNSLNSISGLMRKNENSLAIQAIADLGQLLRQSLDSDFDQFIPLEQELEFIHSYLKMEKLRFGDDLEISVEVDPDLKNSLLPALILQPLVENAIKHGVYKSNKKSKLEIMARRNEDSMEICIINDNSISTENSDYDFHKGVGIKNVEERLKSIYIGKQYTFEVQFLENQKTKALLILPIYE